MQNQAESAALALPWARGVVDVAHGPDTSSFPGVLASGHLHRFEEVRTAVG